MISRVIAAFGGSHNKRVIKKKKESVELSEVDRSGLTDNEVKDGFSSEQNIASKLSFACEASTRSLGLTPHHVQRLGALLLLDNKVVEMHTGEGKTLVAALAACLKPSTHVITVNNYLASRDAEQMKPLYDFLGVTSGLITEEMDLVGRKEAYGAQVTYASNDEIGFDYLRDNLVDSVSGQVQGELPFAIIDEADSILIDESRTPLIISGKSEDDVELYAQIMPIAVALPASCYKVDREDKNVILLEEGYDIIEEQIKKVLNTDNLYHDGLQSLHVLNNCLKALYVYTAEIDYMVSNGEAIIIDEHTGRAQIGRRWSDGIHQAIEAKEGLEVKPENMAMGKISYQNLFRMYAGLSGMTGTAMTEAAEFYDVYGLDVIALPTNLPNLRDDIEDIVYMKYVDKMSAVVDDIERRNAMGQPILVGTVSIDSSEELSKMLSKRKVKHEVLNAKQNERESEIISLAGSLGSVTIATNMAGRGTDIVLGGPKEAIDWKTKHEAVIALGGLHVLGVERNLSRRIDNQLRGRCARQGDPGSSQYYSSLDDDLMQIFAGEKVKSILAMISSEAVEIEHPMVSKSIENAQRKIEAANFDSRKSMLEYDDVTNNQRHVIYKEREEVLMSGNLTEYVDDRISFVIGYLFDQNFSEGFAPTKDNEFAFDGALSDLFDAPINLETLWIEKANEPLSDIRDHIIDIFQLMIKAREKNLPALDLHLYKKQLVLTSIDRAWFNQMAKLDALREGIHLRSYAQKDPKQEYKREAFDLFNEMVDQLQYQTVKLLVAPIEVRAAA